MRIDCLRVLLLRQIKSILRAKKSFTICIEVVEPFFSKLTEKQNLHKATYVFKMSSRRFLDVFKTSLRRLVKTSSRHLQDVLPRRFQDVFKTSSRRLSRTSSTRFQDVFKTTSRSIAKISSRRFQDASSA